MRWVCDCKRSPIRLNRVPSVRCPWWRTMSMTMLDYITMHVIARKRISPDVARLQPERDRRAEAERDDRDRDREDHVRARPQIDHRYVLLHRSQRRLDLALGVGHRAHRIACEIDATRGDLDVVEAAVVAHVELGRRREDGIVRN